MAGLDFLELRHGRGALLACIGAAGAEGAAGGRVQRAGNVAGQHNTLVLSGGLGVRQRNGGHQALGIGVQGMIIDLPGICQLHHFTKVHDGDSVGNVTHNQKIVGNEQISKAHLILQFIKHIDDLCLDRNVQSGNRLVTDNELGIHGHGPGNADALTLTAGELMGIPVGMLGVQAHLAHQLQHPFFPLLLVGVHFVHVQGLGNDVGHGHTGVQRGIGILEHHCALLPVLQNVLLGFNFIAFKEDLTGGGLIQVQQGTAHGGLAAAGFAYKAQGFAPADGEGDIVHSLQRLGGKGAGGNIEILFQMLDFYKGISHWVRPPFPFLPSRSSSRRPGGSR